VGSYASQPVAVQVGASAGNSMSVMMKAAQPATATATASTAVAQKAKPSIAFDASASSFSFQDSQIHAWLDDMVKQREARARDVNAWSIVVKQRTLH